MQYVYWTTLPQPRSQGETGDSSSLSGKTNLWWRHNDRAGWLPISFSEIILARALREAGQSALDEPARSSIHPTFGSVSRRNGIGFTVKNFDTGLFKGKRLIKKASGGRRSPDQN